MSDLRSLYYTSVEGEDMMSETIKNKVQQVKVLLNVPVVKVNDCERNRENHQ